MYDKEYLSVPEVAEMLGLHPESVRKLVRQGSLPAFKAGRSWRFRRTQLQSWLQEHGRERKEPPLVLVVDDEVVVCRLLTRYLERMGYRTVWVTSGHEGLGLLDRQVPDLILLDLVMPVMTGSEFLARLRDVHPGLPVVIVTGYPDSELMHQAMRHPPVLLLEKPVEAEALGRTVAAVLGDRAVDGAAGAQATVQRASREPDRSMRGGNR